MAKWRFSIMIVALVLLAQAAVEASRKPTPVPAQTPTTIAPTRKTRKPTLQPSSAPTPSPTRKPTSALSGRPTTSKPTRAPTPPPTYPSSFPKFFYVRNAVGARAEVGGSPNPVTGCATVVYGCQSGNLTLTELNLVDQPLPFCYNTLNAPLIMNATADENCPCFPAGTRMSTDLYINSRWDKPHFTWMARVAGLHLFFVKFTSMVYVFGLLEETRVSPGSDLYQITDAVKQAAVRAEVDSKFPGDGSLLTFPQRSCPPGRVVPTVITQGECPA